MPAYDQSFDPPTWWLERLTAVLGVLDWNNTQLGLAAGEADGRGRAWPPGRISNLRNGKHGTVELVVAISKAVRIPPPIVLPVSLEEADALERWLEDHRRRNPESNPETVSRRAVALQAVESLIEDAKDQTTTVPLNSEGSPRSPRTRRAPRGRS